MSNAFERFQTILTTIAYLHPDMPVSEALPLAEQVEAERRTRVPAVIRSREDLKALARTLPDVMDNLDHRKIDAIKNLRAEMSTRPESERLTWGGLKECKEACDELSRELRPSF